MDLDKATIVICLTLFIVIGTNAAIYASFRRGNTKSTLDMLRRTATRIRNPWQVEDEALRELSDLASKLRTDKDTRNGESG